MKISSLILSIIVLFQSFNFEIEDFNKIPNFIEDIECHVNAGESFSDFIADHYDVLSNNHNHKRDTCKGDTHGELPFKRQNMDSQIQLVYVFFSDEYPVKSHDDLMVNNNFSYKEPSTKLFTESFFQPPRV